MGLNSDVFHGYSIEGVRGSLRTAQWQIATQGRPIFSGTEGGVDKHLTTAIYRAKRDKALTPLQAGTLRGIQAGSVRPQGNLCSSGLVDTPNCPWGCGAIEDIQHFLWVCLVRSMCGVCSVRCD